MPTIPTSVYQKRLDMLSMFELEVHEQEFTENNIALDAEMWIVHLPNGSNTKDSMAFIERGIIVQFNLHDKAGHLQFESPEYDSIKSYYVIRYMCEKYTLTLSSGDFNMFGYRNCINANRVFKTEASAMEYLSKKGFTFAYPMN